MNDEIARQGVACLTAFKTLESHLKSRDDLQSLVSSHELSDELGRFKVWAGNIGALQSGPSSLDSRLKDASHVREAIVRLLQDLSQALSEACAIASGERDSRTESDLQEPDLEFSSDSSISAASSDDSDGRAPKSEFRELFLSVIDSVTALLKLSIVIRHASPRDRYAKSAKLSAIDDSYDIGHVWQKFPHARSQTWLVDRLGKAVARRRQHLRYCQMHREKMSKNLVTIDESDSRVKAGIGYSEEASDLLQRAGHSGKSDVAPSASNRPSTMDDTKASSLMQPINLTKDLEELEASSEAGLSERSFATSTGDTGLNYLRCPPLPQDAADKQPFECPLCYTIQTVKGSNHWK